MELYTETIGELAGVTTAQLDEYTTGEGVLRLEFAGWGPDWLNYMEPVSLYHRGSLIFHGKVTSFSRSNSGGEVRTTAEVNNFFWLLEHQTLGQQVAEIAEEAASSQAGGGAALSRADFLRIGRGQIGKNEAVKDSDGRYVVTWAAAVATMSAKAYGWKVAPEDDGLISVSCGWAVGSRQMWAITDKLVTTASALWRMRRKAPDVQYIVSYGSGTVTAMNIGALSGVVWDTGDGFVLSAEGIEPQYEQRVTGVAIAWTNDAGVTTLHTYPAGLDMAQQGVKVFHLTGTYYVESWSKVAQEYYNAANKLQYGGSVTVLMDRLSESPLGHLLSLKGEGTHTSWHEMCAVVTHVTWDFLERTLTANLGREFADPEFDDAAETEDGGEPLVLDDSDSGTGPIIFSNPGDSDSPVDPPLPGESESATETESESATETYEPTRPAHTSNDCGCAPKWLELEEWKKSIEERLKALEEGGTGSGGGTSGCNCECAGLLEAIQQAVAQAAAGVSLTASVTQDVMPTETGNLTATASASAAGGSGNSSLNFHY